MSDAGPAGRKPLPFAPQRAWRAKIAPDLPDAAISAMPADSVPWPFLRFPAQLQQAAHQGLRPAIQRQIPEKTDRLQTRFPGAQLV